VSGSIDARHRYLKCVNLHVDRWTSPFAAKCRLDVTNRSAHERTVLDNWVVQMVTTLCSDPDVFGLSRLSPHVSACAEVTQSAVAFVLSGFAPQTAILKRGAGWSSCRDESCSLAGLEDRASRKVDIPLYVLTRSSSIHPSQSA
jgi:hypothetical protein